LLAEQGLLIFPVLSAVCTLIAAVVFAAPAAAILMSSSEAGIDEGSLETVHYVLLFGLYMVTAFVTLFFNTAMVAVAMERLQGRDPRVADGFRVAMANLPSILAFSAVSATVGVILRMVEERMGMIGAIVTGLLGATWAVVTFLVVPVMVVEQHGAFGSIKRSADLLRSTWGAQIAGNLGIGLIVFLLGILGMVPIALGIAIGAGATIVVGIGFALIYWVLLAVASTALGQVYRAAVYLYASTHAVPAHFDGWMLEEAFRPKQSQGRFGI
jgi:hypothetical protein